MHDHHKKFPMWCGWWDLLYLDVSTHELNQEVATYEFDLEVNGLEVHHHCWNFSFHL